MKKTLTQFLCIAMFIGFYPTVIQAQAVKPKPKTTGGATSEKPVSSGISPKYTVAIKRNPDNDTAWYNRGEAYLKVGDFNAAIKDFTQAITLNADNTQAQSARGDAYCKKGDFDLAIPDYSAASDADPEDKGIIKALGNAYRIVGQYKSSVKAYSEGLKIDANDDTILYNLGIDYYKLGKYDSAIVNFSNALTIRPNSPVYVSHYILALCSDGSYSPANDEFVKYKQKKLNSFIETPDYSFLKIYITACANNLNSSDYAGALVLLQQSAAAYKPVAPIGEKPDSIDYANILAKIGFVYEKLDSVNAALAYYQKAQNISPDVQDAGAKISRLQYMTYRKVAPPVIKLLSPQSRGIKIDYDTVAGQKLVANIEVSAAKGGQIIVKGIAESASGISQVKINDSIATITTTDTTGVFEMGISDTSFVLHIQAWNKNNIVSDTTFHLISPKNQIARSFKIIPIGNKDAFHAILIACSNYTGTKWPQLETTIADADSLKQELIKEYNFKPENIVTIYNQDKSGILKGLGDKLESLGEDDNVLIFYGGHGDLDRQTNIAYWVPLNKEAKQYEYISNNEITDALQNVKAKHVLVMSDACYGGAMRGAEEEYEPNANEYRVQSRQLLTSGNAETVPGVSVFIPTILEELKLNDDAVFSVNDLYINIAKTIRIQSGKTPIFKPLEGIRGSISYGQFYFKKNMPDSNRVKTPEEIAQQKITEELAKKEYLRKKSTRDSLIASGKAKKDREQLSDALADFKSAVEINPDPNNTYAKNLYDDVNKLNALTPDQHYQMCVDSAKAYEINKDHATALIWYKKAGTVKPDQKPQLELLMGPIYGKQSNLIRINELYKAGDFKGAIKALKEILRKEPNDVEYYMVRAKCYDALGQSYYSDAFDDLTKAINLERSYAPSTKARAELQAKYGHKLEAISDYKTYISFENDPLAYMALSKLHIEQNSKDEAIDDLSSAININTGYTEAYYNRGLLYFEYKKDYQKAFADFNTAVQQDPTNPLNYFQRGSCYLNLNNVYDAAWDFNSARAYKLDNSYVQNIEAFAAPVHDSAVQYAAKGVNNFAIIIINRAILISPAYAVYRYEKGNYLSAIDSFAQAAISYDTAISLNPEYKEAFYSRGMAYYNLKKYEKAIESFDGALKLNPSDLYSAKGKADSYFALKDYKNATPVYELALKIIDDGKSSAVTDSVKSRINNNLGYSYYKDSSYDQSIKYLKKAVNLDQNYGLAYYNLGKSYEKSNDPDNAAEKVDKALTYETDHYDWYYSGAEIYRNKSNFGKAADYYTHAIENDSSHLLKTAFYYRGYSYKMTGDFADAATDYLKAISLHVDTGFHEFNNELGNIYYSMADNDSAYIYYNKSFINDSSDANAMAAYGMASALFLQNKTAEALVLFERALKTAAVPKAFIKKDKNYDLFRQNKKFKDLFNKYY